MDDLSTNLFKKLLKSTGYDQNINSKELQKTILQQFDKIDRSKCLILPDAKKWLLYLGRITGQIYTLDNLVNAEHCQQNIENRYEVHTNRALSSYTRKISYVDESSIHCSNPYHYSKPWRPDMNKVTRVGEFGNSKKGRFYKKLVQYHVFFLIATHLYDDRNSSRTICSFVSSSTNSSRLGGNDMSRQSDTLWKKNKLTWTSIESL